MSVIYHLIVLIVAAGSAIWGFRKGFTSQIPSLIGLAMGIVSARLLAPGLEGVLYGAFPSVHGKVEQIFVYNTISSALVFTAVYFIFKTLTFFLSRVFRSKDPSILNNIGGAIVGMFKYLLGVSIVFNLMVAMNRDSQLLRYVKSDDGNAVEEVMLLSPALLGGEDVMELSHKLQLEEAKKIS